MNVALGYSSNALSLPSENAYAILPRWLEGVKKFETLQDGMEPRKVTSGAGRRFTIPQLDSFIRQK